MSSIRCPIHGIRDRNTTPFSAENATTKMTHNNGIRQPLEVMSAS